MAAKLQLAEESSQRGWSTNGVKASQIEDHRGQPGEALDPSSSATGRAAQAAADGMVAALGQAVPPAGPVVATVVARSGHPQFLEKLKQPSAQPVVNRVRDFVGAFPANLTRPQAARRIHAFLSEVTPRLLQTKAFADDSVEDAHEAAMEGLEKFVVLKLYKLLFRHAPADLREDEHAEQCIRKAAAGPLPVELSKESRELFEAAAAELQKVDQYRAPRDKAVCMLNAYRIVEGIFVEDAYHKGNANGSGQDAFLRRILVALVAKACPPNCFSNFEFTAAFRHPSRISSEEQRCFRELAAALASVTGRAGAGTLARQAAAAAEEDPSSSSGDAASTLPLWLADAGVTFHFEGREGVDLRVGELDELLDEYHRMSRALRELAAEPHADARQS